MTRTTQAIPRGFALLLACAFLGACAATPGASVTPGARSTTIATPTVAAPSPSSFASLAPSGGTQSPTPGVIPLLFGCSHDAPCNLKAGTYETSGRWAFLRGLRVTVPAGWSSDEQDAGEFNLHPMDQPDAELFFWKDISATRNDFAGTPVPDVPTTEQGYLSWLTANPDLIVSKPRPTSVGHVPVAMVDVRTSPTATNNDPGCPAPPCVAFLRDVAHWQQPWSSSHAEVLRMYLGTIGPASDRHTFVVAIDFQGLPGLGLDAFTERVGPILDSVVIPDVIVDN